MYVQQVCALGLASGSAGAPQRFAISSLTIYVCKIGEGAMYRGTLAVTHSTGYAMLTRQNDV
jgi:hypothetical protein